MKEVVFQGAIDPHTPVAQGWLRASHRKLDKKLSLPYRPYHTHDEKQPLKPGEVVELDIEIWPTSIVVPAGSSHRPDHPRQGLRIWRAERRQAVELQERAEGLRPVPAQRSAATARWRSSAAPRRCISAATSRPICCCRSFPPRPRPPRKSRPRRARPRRKPRRKPGQNRRKSRPNRRNPRAGRNADMQPCARPLCRAPSSSNRHRERRHGHIRLRPTTLVFK